MGTVAQSPALARCFDKQFCPLGQVRESWRSVASRSHPIQQPESFHPWCRAATDYEVKLTVNSPLNLTCLLGRFHGNSWAGMLTLRGGSRMFPGRTLLLLGLGLSLCLTTLSATAAGLLRPAVDFPLPVDSYHDQHIPSLFGKLTGRIRREPLNLVRRWPKADQFASEQINRTIASTPRNQR